MPDTVPPTTAPQPPWYVAQALPNHQTKAIANIRTQLALNVFAPREAHTAIIRGRLAERLRYAFGTYLFIQAPLRDAATWQALTATRGIARVIGGGSPWPLKPGTVEALQARCDADGYWERDAGDRALATLYRVGQTVHAERGMWAGHYGVVVRDEIIRGRIAVVFGLFNRGGVAGGAAAEGGVAVPVEVVMLAAAPDDPTARRYDKAVRGRGIRW